MVPLIVCGLLNLYMTRRGEIEEEGEGVSEPTNALSLPYLPCEYSEEEDEEDCANLAGVNTCRVTKGEVALGI